MTLFVPHSSAGFVALDDGTVRLQRILIPVDHVPRPHAAVEMAAALVQALGCGPVIFTLVYVGTAGGYARGVSSS